MGRDMRFDLSDDEVPTLAQAASLQDASDDDFPDPLASSHPANRDADHHTIVDMNLRTLRFVSVAAVAMAVAFTYAFLTNGKAVVARKATQALAEAQVGVYNTLLGTVMFTAGKVFEIYTETLIFPTLHTYLHNCSLYPGDEPQRVSSKVKRNFIFWGLKTVIILMNVGTSSLYVSTRQHVNTSASARMLSVDVHARRLEGLGDGAVHGVFDGFLTSTTTAFLADETTACGADGLPWSTADVDYSSVAFGFTRQPWSETVVDRMLPTQPSSSVVLGRLTGCVKDAWACQQVLMASGVSMDDVSVMLTRAAESLRAQTASPVAFNATQASSNATIELALADLQQSIVSGFSGVVTAQPTLTIDEHAYTSGIYSVSATIEFSRPVDSSSVVCGSKHCVAAVDAAPQQRITMDAADDGVFTSSLARRVTRVNNSLQDVISLSFSLLTVSPSADDLSLLTDGLIADVSSTQLLSKPTRKVSLVDLHAIVLPDTKTQRLTTWLPIEQLPQSTKSQAQACSPVVDAFVGQFSHDSFSLSSPSLAATSNTAALLFLTQEKHTPVTAMERRLAESKGKIKLILGIPEYSAIATFTGCGIMVVLTAFVIMRPTARVRLTPNTTPAAQYVQILTDDLYPNIVHKKRLRFANGEVLPFNEYVVDSIVLSAKRDASKKIYLT